MQGVDLLPQPKNDYQIDIPEMLEEEQEEVKRMDEEDLERIAEE